MVANDRHSDTAETNRIQVFDSDGQFVNQFFDDRLGRFQVPEAIAAAPDGNLYILDIGNEGDPGGELFRVVPEPGSPVAFAAAALSLACLARRRSGS